MFGYMSNGTLYWRRPDGSIIVLKEEEEFPDEVKSDLNELLDENR